ncbi:MAG: hypothetical protein IKA64_01970 [Clostridia bacterium]|nr:hypothetical protein [Clostridia bacterium]
MKVSKKLKSLLENLASNAMSARRLNQLIQKEFEKLGVDTDSQEFISAFGYIEGDGDIAPIIDYIESEEV